jgi:DHA1 family bicyclomycin/chloramphenicol resistance-like MFS transporter
VSSETSPATASTQEAPSGTPRAAPWRLLALLIAMSGVGSMSLNILAPAIPGLVAKFATDAGSVQLTISLYIMGLAVAQLVFGPLSDRFGRRPVVLAGLGLATLASTAAIFVSTIGGLVAARVVQSLGASTGQTISRAIIRDLYDRERAASMIGLVTSVVVLMPMMAPLLGGILDTLFGWSAIFIFVALFSAAVFLWAALALPETRRFSTVPGANGQLVPDFKALAQSPRFFGYALCAGLGSGPFFSFLGGAPHVTVTMLGRSSAEYGLWFFLPSFGFMLGNFLVSRLSGRFTIDTLIWWGIGATVVGSLISIVLYPVLPGWEMTTIFLPQIIVGCGNGLLLPTAVAGAVSIRPHVAGTASGLIGFIQMAIGAAAAQLSGHIIGHATTAMPMLVQMLLFGIATGVAVFWLVRRP